MNKVFLCVLAFVMYTFVDYTWAKPITPKSIKVSSKLGATENENFDAANLLDNKLKTVWAAPFKGKPVSITLEVDAFAINSLRVLNGYRRTKDAYEGYGRACYINIYANDRKHLVKTERLTDHEWEYAMGEQTYKGCIAYLKEIGTLFKEYEFDVDKPCEKEDQECWGKRRFLKDNCSRYTPKKYYEEIFFEKPLKGVKKLIIDIVSTYNGKREDDSFAITEISLDGHQTNPLKKGVAPKFGSFRDKRDGKKYKTVKIGNKIWMAEYLKYDAKDTSCFLGYGRMPCNENAEYRIESISESLCPAGWRLPTMDDVAALVQTVKSFYEDSTMAIYDVFDSPRSSRSLDLAFWNKRPDVNEMDDVVSFSERMEGKFGRQRYTDPRMSVLWLAPVDTDSGKVVSKVVLSSNGDVAPFKYSWFANVRCIKE